jgi:two-component system, sporulation sensor kinase E
MKQSFLDKLIDRLDLVDPKSLQTQFLRLAKEKGLLETIFNALQEGVLVLDRSGSITYANQSASKLLGFDPDKVLGEPISKHLRDVDWEGIMAFDEEEWARLVRREIEISYPERRFIQFYMVPLSEGEKDQAEGGVVILRDVTRDRKQQESHLESERVQAITLLAAEVAHEIGNPLNSLTIHLQLLEREIAQLEAGEARNNLAELTEVARDEITRLDGILTQFLGAIRPSTPDREPCDLKVILENSIAVMTHEIEDRGVWIEVEFPENTPMAMVDKDMIRQAFFNIIKNAIQAMMGGGLIKVTARHNDQFVSIAFTDTGSGISAEDLSQLFEPYHTTKTGGSGLGLMIVQRIVRDHGGLMEIDSEPNKGSTFTLHLPREDQRIRLLEAPVQEVDNE